jgi:hypothetical protein
MRIKSREVIFGSRWLTAHAAAGLDRRMAASNRDRSSRRDLVFLVGTAGDNLQCIVGYGVCYSGRRCKSAPLGAIFAVGSTAKRA